MAGTFAGKNLLRAKYYVDTIPQKRQISWAIIYVSSLICSIKSPLATDIPDKLNFTSCDSSLRPFKWKLLSSPFPWYLYLFCSILQEIWNFLQNFTLATLGVKARINSVSGMF